MLKKKDEWFEKGKKEVLPKTNHLAIATVRRECQHIDAVKNKYFCKSTYQNEYTEDELNEIKTAGDAVLFVVKRAYISKWK